ncbi:MAG TPA: hypothetical protein VIJ94_19925 [Caulobacteraceae bacterium]
MTLRYRICPDCGELHDVHDWPENHRFWNEVLCAPMVISDTMAPIQSQVDGRIYDSKAAIRAGYRTASSRDGRDYVEVGNDPARLKPFKRQAPDKKAIRTALERSAARVANGEYTERGKRIDLTRPARKAPKHNEPNGPPVRSGVVRPAFQ